MTAQSKRANTGTNRCIQLRANMRLPSTLSRFMILVQNLKVYRLSFAFWGGWHDSTGSSPLLHDLWHGRSVEFMHQVRTMEDAGNGSTGKPAGKSLLTRVITQVGDALLCCGCSPSCSSWSSAASASTRPIRAANLTDGSENCRYLLAMVSWVAGHK